MSSRLACLRITAQWAEAPGSRLDLPHQRQVSALSRDDRVEDPQLRGAPVSTVTALQISVVEGRRKNQFLETSDAMPFNFVFQLRTGNGVSTGDQPSDSPCRRLKQTRRSCGPPCAAPRAGGMWAVVEHHEGPVSRSKVCRASAVRASTALGTITPDFSAARAARSNSER
jgi:hypothetical protein